MVTTLLMVGIIVIFFFFIKLLNQISQKIDTLEQKLERLTPKEPKVTPEKSVVATPPVPQEQPIPPKPTPTYTVSPPKERVRRQPSEFEQKTQKTFAKIYNWLVVGEEFRPTSVAMEYSVITVWLIRIAIVILLFGVGFFMKYSHENNLISEALRVAIVVTSGIVLIGVGSYFINKKYHIISLATVGLGFSSLYFASFAGVYLYKIVSTEVGFIFLIFVTLGATLLAIKFNALSLALISLVGGYLAPFLVSSGSGNLEILTGYLTILAIGALVVSRYRNWPVLYILSFIFNYLILVGLLIVYPVSRNFVTLFLFSLGGFLIFSASSIIYNLRQNIAITALEVIMTILNFMLFSGASALIFIDYFRSRSNLGYVALALAIFYGMQMYDFWHSRRKDKVLYATIAILGVISLTLFWPLFCNAKEVVSLMFSLQAIGLIYLAAQSRSNLLNNLGVILYIFAAFWIATTTSSAVGFVERFMSVGAYSCALMGGFFIQKYSKLSVDKLSKTTVFLRYMSLIVVSIYLLRESEYLPFNRYWNQGLQITFVILILMGASCFLAWRSALNRENIFLKVVNIIVQFLVCSISIGLVIGYFQYNLWRYNIMLQLTMTTILLGVFAGTIYGYKKSSDIKTLGIGFILFFLYSSQEIYFFTKNIIDSRVSLLAVSILWAVYAAMLLYFGLRLQRKYLRIIGFLLFIITAFKVIFLDTEGFGLYRIGAFITIGLLMIIGAIFYIKNSNQFIAPAVK